MFVIICEVVKKFWAAVEMEKRTENLRTRAKRPAREDNSPVLSSLLYGWWSVCTFHATILYCTKDCQGPIQYCFN